MSVSGAEPERAAEIARWAMGRGLKALKVKVGIEPEGDLARVKAVRAAIGPSVRLGVDANGGWSPRVAMKQFAVWRLSATSTSPSSRSLPWISSGSWTSVAMPRPCDGG